MPYETLKLSIQIQAGVLPGSPMPEYSKTWHITSEEYQDPDKFLTKAGAANLYCLTLQDPSRVNWVKLEWIWY